MTDDARRQKRVRFTLKSSAASLLSLVMLGQTAFAYIPDTSLWSERKSNKPLVLASAAPMDAALAKPAAIQRILSDIKASPGKTEARGLGALLPAAFLSDVHVKRATQGTRKGAVVILEDVHQNVEAQQHLSSALLTLAAEPGQTPVRVALEGAAGEFLFDVFHRFPDSRIARSVVDSFLNSGDLAGPSHAGFSDFPAANRRGLKFVGADDAVHYARNVNAYKATEAVKKTAFASVAERLQTLLEARPASFSKELLALDISADKHHRGEMPLSEYVAVLSKSGVASSPVLTKFLTACDMERKLDMPAIERERRTVLEKLVARLTDPEIRSLVQLTFGYRQGQVTFGGYHAELERLCRTHDVDLSRTPAFNAYLNYVLLSDGVQADALFAAIEEAEGVAYARLATTPESARLAAELKQARRAVRLIGFALSSSEWTAYKENRSALAGLDLQPFERFYEEAELRDAAMVNAVSKGEGLRVLVAGGFHSDAVAAALRSAGLSVIVCTPRLTKVGTGPVSAYLSVFDREKTPLDKIFSGQKLFLASVPAGSLDPLVDMADPTGQIAHDTLALMAHNGGDLSAAEPVARTLGDSVTDLKISRDGASTTISANINGQTVVTEIHPSADGMPRAPDVVSRRTIGTVTVDTHVAPLVARSFANRIGLMIPGVLLVIGAVLSQVIAGSSDFSLVTSITVASIGLVTSIIFPIQAAMIALAYRRPISAYPTILSLRGYGFMPTDPNGPVAAVVSGRILLNPYYFAPGANTSRLSTRAQRSLMLEERRHLRYQLDRGLTTARNRSSLSLMWEEFRVNLVMPLQDFFAGQRNQDPALLRERAELIPYREKLLREQANPGSEEFEQMAFISDEHGTIDALDFFLMDAILQVRPIDGIDMIDSAQTWSVDLLDQAFRKLVSTQGLSREIAPGESVEAYLAALPAMEREKVKGKRFFHNLRALTDDARFGPQVAARAAEYVAAGFEFQLNPDQPLEDQLRPFGLGLADLKGKIFFHNLGDFMDRGPYGIKVFNRSAELIDADISDVITGNHDLLPFLNLLGIHLPWYKGFRFYGYTDSHDADHGNVEQLVKDFQRDHPKEGLDKGWWAEVLGEAVDFHQAEQANRWNGTVDKKAIELYEIVKGSLTGNAVNQKLWDRLRGFDLVPVYTGTRAVSEMSIPWWEGLLREFKNAYETIKPAAGVAPTAEQQAWLDAINMIDHDILNAPLERGGLRAVGNKMIADGKWWWRVVDAINAMNYTSPEWYGKDWVFHKEWGPNVLAELNEIMRARNGDAAVKVTNRNYFSNPEIERMAKYMKKNFTLFKRDRQQNTYMHAFLPIDKETGEFFFEYKGVKYRGRGAPGVPSVWQGLDRIQNDVRAGTTLAELSEPLGLVNSWYADNTTRIKPNHVAEMISKFGADHLARVNGFNRLFSGHLPFYEFNKQVGKYGVPTGFQTSGQLEGTDTKVARIVFTDHGGGKRYGSRGGYVMSSENMGLYLRAREHEKSKGLFKDARTVMNAGDAKGTDPVKTWFYNAGIPASDHLAAIISDVDKRLQEIDYALDAPMAARSFENRLFLMVPFVAAAGLMLWLGNPMESFWQAIIVGLGTLGALVFGRQAYGVIAADLSSVYPEITGPLHWAVGEYQNFSSESIEAGQVRGGEIYLKRSDLSRMSLSQQISVISEEIRHVRYQKYWDLKDENRTVLSLMLEEIVVNLFMPLFDIFRPNPEIRRLSRPFALSEAIARAQSGIPASGDILRSLTPSTDSLQDVVKNFMLDMDNGIKHRRSALEMIDTGATFPTGRESGFFVTIDWGGSNARVTLWELQGRGRIRSVKTLPENISFTDEQKKNPRELFLFIAAAVEDLVKPSSLENEGVNFRVGITFAFPPSKWSKGWSDPEGLPPMSGDELIAGFNKAFKDLRINNIRATATANDTLDPMMIETYERRADNPNAPAARVSVILGTGHNVAAELDGVIRNFESAAFDGLAAITTPMDKETDRTQSNPGEHLLEKMVSGGYLGEILRTSLARIRAQTGEFSWNTEFFSVPNQLPTRFVSEILATEGDTHKIENVLRLYGISQSTWNERLILYATAQAVVDRSARLVAAELAAIIRMQDPQLKGRHIVPIEGSIFEKTPAYPTRLKNALAELLGQSAADRIELVPNRGRTGAGAALIAATAKENVGTTESQSTVPATLDLAEAPLNRVRTLDDGTKVIRVRALNLSQSRAGLATAMAAVWIDLPGFFRVRNMKGITIQTTEEPQADARIHARSAWTFTDPTGEYSGEVTLTIDGDIWTITAKTSIEQLTVDVFSHLMGVLAIRGLLGGESGGASGDRLHADGVAALGLTLLALGMPIGLGILIGSLTAWMLISLRQPARRAALAGGIVGLAFVLPAAAAGIAAVVATVAAYRYFAPAIAARRWVAEGRQYATAAAQLRNPGRSLVDVLNEAAPRGVYFGRATANDLRNASLSGFVQSAEAETNPARKAFQWSSFAGYLRSASNGNAVSSAVQAADRYTKGVKTSVMTYHLNQVGEGALKSELSELRELVERAKAMRGAGTLVAVVVAVTGELPKDYQSELSGIIASSEGVAARVSVTEDLRTADGLAYSYEELLRKSLNESQQDAVRALLNGSYDTAAFVTFSKIPSQFLANGRLRAIWTVLANIGEGWAPLPVETLLRAAELAKQQA